MTNKEELIIEDVGPIKLTLVIILKNVILFC